MIRVHKKVQKNPFINFVGGLDTNIATKELWIHFITISRQASAQDLAIWYLGLMVYQACMLDYAITIYSLFLKVH